jgi:hypothetical protein
MVASEKKVLGLMPRASASTFCSDATINGCGVGVDSQYLGFICEYLAEVTPNLNVFDTLPIWESEANFLKLMPG